MMAVEKVKLHVDTWYQESYQLPPCWRLIAPLPSVSGSPLFLKEIFINFKQHFCDTLIVLMSTSPKRSEMWWDYIWYTAEWLTGWNRKWRQSKHKVAPSCCILVLLPEIKKNGLNNPWHLEKWLQWTKGILAYWSAIIRCVDDWKKYPLLFWNQMWRSV